MHIPANASKRHFPIEALTGLDSLLALVLPRAWMCRVLALKLLRAWGELPAETNVAWQLLFGGRARAVYDMSFDWLGVYQIIDTRGRVLRAGHVPAGQVSA